MSSTSSAARRARPSRISRRRLGQCRDGEFTKGLSRLGKKDGVNVNIIHPGLTANRPRARICSPSALSAAGKTIGEIGAEAIARDGIRRIGEVEDVAELAVFLCSEPARHIQGTAIPVDGGSTVGYY